MNWEDAYKVAGALLSALGGSALVLGALFTFVSKIWHQRIVEHLKSKLQTELESHKVGLRKSEYLFNREFHAVSALTALIRKIEPGWTHPEMDWTDGGAEIAKNLAKIEKLINRYLTNHSAALNDEVRELLQKAFYRSGEWSLYNGNPENLHSEGHELFEILKEAEKKALKELRGQIRS